MKIQLINLYNYEIFLKLSYLIILRQEEITNVPRGTKNLCFYK